MDAPGRAVQWPEPESIGGSTLPNLLTVEDLSAATNQRYSLWENDPSTLDGIARVLSRQTDFHVLLTGDRGVGKTTALRLLAEFAKHGRWHHLRDRRFLRIDCRYVPSDDGRSVLGAIVSQSANNRRLVLCLDSVASLLRRSDGRPIVSDFVIALHRSQVPIVGVLSRWEYNDLLAGHADLHELCTRVEVSEPPDDCTLAIVGRHANAMQENFGVEFSGSVLQRAVDLASSYLLSERQPAKSIRVLRLACENAAFDRAQGASSGNLAEGRVEISEASVVSVIAAISGIPRETLSGESVQADYEAAIQGVIFGQEPAVRVVANELRLIRAGLTDPGKPASVLFFAGVTGVGKTELAKRLAELYSSSKRLNIYPMGNYTEPHTVSGILGVPPGYVGHEQGGRLINELIADPYAVFLLDEAEKAHPNVWKPFLNLFDEGWIEDPRGVRAWGDRAIFILTSNAGSDQIGQMTQSGATEAEIEERVKSSLARVKHERSSQPVFTPQFLARMKRIVVFRPLDELAMIGIASKLIAQVQHLWHQKREHRLVVDETLIEWIGRRGHFLNQKSGGKEGGRIIRKLISDVIETRVQDEFLRHPNQGADHRSIHVEFADSQVPSSEATDLSIASTYAHPNIVVRLSG